MDAKQVRQLIENGALGVFSLDVHERDGRLVANDRVALPVHCDASLPRLTDLEVYAEDKSLLGVLCFTSDDRSALCAKTDYSIVAYLTELQADEFSLFRPLRNDYLVVDKDLLDAYIADYAESSPIWGGFAHLPDTDSARSLRNVLAIEARKGIKFPHSAAAELGYRAVRASHPFERFLKHYHQLEMVVDWHVARRISRLPEDLSGFDKIMSSYAAGDLPRMKDLLETFCTNKQAILAKMNDAAKFLPTAERMFQDFSKSGNPLNLHGWDNWKAGKLAERDILSVAAYWIFRVRCSIAHHRIGEYLIKESDEDFVVFFAEPLLLEIISQVFSGDAMRRLV
ncbi:hypothetical protein ABIE51_003740 [Lysobacter sp. OAE881]|uniref:hypothetical protein n=1 Tax=Lysobacter sp. OAE881 TaxID=2663813 RepID=UPI00178B0E2E